MPLHETHTASSRSSIGLDYQPGLDGLRGLAVTAVLLYHAGFRWMVGGFLGVSTFFTLSGYLITSLLVAEYEQNGRIDLPRFWERRFRRILPASFLALALVVLFGAFFADRYQREHLLGDGISTLLNVVNWWFIFTRRDYADIFGSPSPVQHFWSLAIEEQFYVVFPLLMIMALRVARGSRRTLVTIIGGLAVISVARMLALAPTDVPTARLYYGTDTRAAELLAGSLLALALRRRSSPGRWTERVVIMFGVAGLAVSCVFWTTMRQQDARLYSGGLTLYAAATTAVLAATVFPRGPVRDLLSLAPLRRLGQLSYGVYLYHFPIFLALTPERVLLDKWPLLALRLAVTLAMASLSFEWIESPVHSRRVIFGRNRVLAPLVATCTVAAALLVLTQAFPPAAAVSDASAERAAKMRPDALRIMVVGDSVAQNLAIGLKRWAEASGEAGVVINTRVGCGIAHGGVAADRDAQLRVLGCAEWVDNWRNDVAAVDPQVVVVYSAGWDLLDRQLPEWPTVLDIQDPQYRSWLRSEYQQIIDRLTARGARVVWLSPICVKWRPIGAAEVYDPERLRLLSDVIRGVVNDNAKIAQYVDLFSMVCPHGEFTGTLNGIENARPDGVHFSDAAADWVTRWLVPQIQLAAHPTDRLVQRDDR